MTVMPRLRKRTGAVALPSAAEPLGLPRGSVRAILALGIAAAAVAAAFVPMHGDQAARSMLYVIAGVVLRDYFGTRAAQNVADGPALPSPSLNDEN